MEMIGKEKLLSVSQVASLCGVGHSTVSAHASELMAMVGGKSKGKDASRTPVSRTAKAPTHKVLPAPRKRAKGSVFQRSQIDGIDHAPNHDGPLR